METLLSHSFDYLSSASPQKIRKGLRQVEGLLAQLCLSKASNAVNKRQSMLLLGSSTPSPQSKKLSELPVDPAFREFFKLQQSFQWNIAMRLVSCLERLLGKESNGTNDMLIIQTLDLIQGVLLLHPPSRGLFSQEIYMNVSNLVHLFMKLDLSVSNSCFSTFWTLRIVPRSNPPRLWPLLPPSSTSRKILAPLKPSTASS